MLGTLLVAGDLERDKNHCPAEACVLAGIGVRGGGRHKQANKFNNNSRHLMWVIKRIT